MAPYFLPILPMQHDIFEDMARCLSRAQLFPVSLEETRRALAELEARHEALQHPRGIRPRGDQGPLL